MMSERVRTITSPNSLTIPQAKAASSVDLLAWPHSMAIFLVGVAALYASTLADAVRHWLTVDDSAYGLLLSPIIVLLIWLQRDAIRTAPRRPMLAGLPLLALGVGVQSASELLQIRFFGLWSLVLTLAGGILLLHGPALWKIVRFPVLMILAASPLPGSLTSIVRIAIQNASTVGATDLMSFLGYSLIRSGNVIQVPGMTLEVAAACSGIHTLNSVASFALVYGYIFNGRPLARILLLLFVVPVALVTNVLRLSILVAAASAGGPAAYHAAHNVDAWGAVLFSGLVLGLIGRSLGCTTPRFGLG